MHRFFDEVHAFIRTYDLLDRGESVLVGFSGGPDSMFLVDALLQISQTYRYNWSLRLAHLNHGITEAGDDNESFCREVAASRWNLPITVRRVSIPMLRDSGRYRGMSMEQLGRRERYRLFIDTCRDHGLTRLATGHQLDDQAETVLMRAVGGSWLAAMAGIPVRRPLARDSKVEVVRPLLRIERAQIDEWVASERVPVFRDATNADPRYTRNKVRHTLMPLLVREFNPGVKRHLAALGFQAAELETELQHTARAFLAPAQARGGDTVMRVDLSELRARGPLAQRYILRQALIDAGLPIREATHRRIETLRDLIGSERRGVVLKLNENTSVMLDDADLVITVAHAAQLQPALSASEFEIAADGTWEADVNRGPIARITLEMMAMPEGGVRALMADKPPEVEYLDAEKVLFPLLVRARQDGDRLQTLGMDGERKLHDLLIDNKVPRHERDFVPLVCDSLGVICVCGHAMAHRVRVTPTTSQLLCLTMIARPQGSSASSIMPPVT